MSSPWHAFFHPVKDGQARCCTCGADVAVPNAGTSGKIAHMLAAHRTEHDGVVIKQLRERMKSTSCSQPSVATLFQPKTSSAAHRAKSKRLMALTCAGDLKSLNLFEGVFMKQLLAHESGGSNTGHSHSTLMTECNNIKLQQDICHGEEVADMESFSLDTDCWSCSSKAFTCFNYHGIRTPAAGPWTLVTRCFVVRELKGSHTASTLAGAIDDAIDYLADLAGDHMSLRPRMWACIADGAPAQQSALQQLGDGFSIWALWCICHVLHLSVKDAFKRSPVVLEVLKKMRRLAASIRMSNLLTAELHQINEGLNIAARRVALDVITRWTSTRSSVATMLENRQGIDKLQDKAAENTNKRDARSRKNALNACNDEHEIDETINRDDLSADKSVTPVDWLIAEHVEKALSIVAKATTFLEADTYGTLGLVIPSYVHTLTALENLELELAAEEADLAAHQGDTANALKEGIAFIVTLRTTLSERFNPYDFSKTNHSYLVATFLLPGLNKFPFFKGEQKENAIKTAKKFLLADMAEVQRATFIPEWALVEDRFYKQNEGHEHKDEDIKPPPPPKKQKQHELFSEDLFGDDDDDDGAVDECGNDLRLRPSNVTVVNTYACHTFNKELKSKATDAVAMLGALRELVRVSIDMTLLVRVALRYYHTPAASASSERVWSSGTNVMADNRKSFTGDNASVMVQLHCNLNSGGENLKLA